MSALEPGLYRATVRGVADVTVFVDGSTQIHTLTLVRDVWGNDYSTHHEHQITDAHPLVTLDVPFGDHAGDHWPRLVPYLRRGGWDFTADQIEAQTKPARIPEPDPGERATACPRLSPDQPEAFLRLRWSKTKDEEGWHWVSLATGHVYQWHSLIDPTLIREGLS